MRIERDGALGCGAETPAVRCGRTTPRPGRNGQMIRRARRPRPPRGGQRPSQGIGLQVEAVRIFFAVQHRQHGPAVGMVREPAARHVPEPSCAAACSSGVDALEVAEAAQHRLVGLSSFRVPLRSASLMLCGRTPWVSATVETMRGTRSSCSSKVSLRAESAIIVLGPQMGAGDCVHQLYREAQLGARLAQAPSIT